MIRLRLLARLVHMLLDDRQPPPDRYHDPALPAARIETGRVLSKADRVLAERERLNAELDRTVDAIRAPRR